MKYSRIFLLFIALTAVVCCSTPESDGRKAAKLFSDIEAEAEAYTKSQYLYLIDNFYSQGFTSRTDVNDRIDEINADSEKLRKEKRAQADKFYEEKYRKYVTNQKKNSEFMYAYRSYSKIMKPIKEDLTPLIKQIDSLRLTIIPVQPTLEQIKRDLVGRKISGLPGSYLSDNWYWVTDCYEQIKEADITYEDFGADTYICGVHLILQADGGAYESEILAHYKLGNADDWTLDLIESRSIELLRTGKYDNCITSRRTGWLGEYAVEFTNSSDARLAVGGQVKYEYGEGWKKFCIVVEGNSSEQIGGLFWGSLADYKIDFVERP